ncbi:MAG: hypothetical protein R2855_16380 [Thermomicrobiales bacterium]
MQNPKTRDARRPPLRSFPEATPRDLRRRGDIVVERLDRWPGAGLSCAATSWVSERLTIDDIDDSQIVRLPNLDIQLQSDLPGQIAIGRLPEGCTERQRRSALQSNVETTVPVP